jgi:hypothetical protein
MIRRGGIQAVTDRLRTAAAVALACSLTACGDQSAHNPVLQSPESMGSGGAGISLTVPVGPGPSMRSCADVGPGRVHCDALIRTDIASLLTLHPGILAGYGPSDLQEAYGLTSLTSSRGAGQTVAIVDAYKDPAPSPDLAAYRAAFGLPACTVGNGCLMVHAFGSATDEGWAEEESLDLDMASAICPHCKILLVEAASDSIGALVTAERYAKSHATVVSNSWGGSESAASSADAAFASSTDAIVASTGDSGYNKPAQWPAILPSVIGAGGTSLTSVSPRVESAWSGAGSGCSKVYAKPAFQTAIATGCAKRAEADVSAVADPNTGVAVYDSDAPVRGWAVFGGTSVSSPIIASIFALGSIAANDDVKHLYADKADLNDITSGSNGSCGPPLCTAGKGWDGPTGLGSPDGDGAF